jgi:hypothetical protein
MSLCPSKKQPTPLKIKKLEEPWLAEARKQALLNTHDSDGLGLAIEARAMTR